MGSLETDIRRYRGDFPSRRLSVAGLLARSASLQVIAVYRLGQWVRYTPHRFGTLWRQPVYWCAYVPLRELLSRSYGIRLDLSANIGPGLYIGHVGGIEIWSCTIGAYCSIAQQTKIGPATPGARGPVIGSYVWIGAHAHVLGAITVGDGATIAAGAHVSRDVPPHALVAGNPARAVRWFYDNPAIAGDGAGRTTRTPLVEEERGRDNA